MSRIDRGGLRLVACLLALTLGGAAQAVGPGAGAVILQFDPSARAGGMGGAGSAVWWGQAPDHWANPALLGYHRGLRYEFARHPLAQGIAPDIHFEAQRLTFGIAGIGLLATGPREYLLDMGWLQGTDELGQPTESYHSYMVARTWGVGISLAGLVDAVRLDPEGDGDGLSRHLDVAVGIVEKEFADFLAPEWLVPGGSSGTIADRDLGLLVRVTPLNTVGREEAAAGPLGPIQALSGGLRLDLGYARSVQNSRERWIIHTDASQGDPMPKMHRRGVAVHLATGLPDRWRDGLTGRRLGWVAESLTPLLSWGYAWDEVTAGIRWIEAEQRFEFARDESDQEHSRGWELSLANIYHIRRGRLRYSIGQVEGPTEGWGLSLPLGRFAGWRYDEARVPQAEGLPRSWRRSWTVFFDGFELWRALNPRARPPATRAEAPR